MVTTIILTIKVYLAVWLWCNFDPIQDNVNGLFTRLPDNWFTNVLFVALGCTKCLTLWFTLIFTGSIWWAIAASMVASIQSKLTA